jgi:hypothetical protein
MPYKSETPVGNVNRHLLFHCRAIVTPSIVFAAQPNGLSYPLSVLRQLRLAEGMSEPKFLIQQCQERRGIVHDRLYLCIAGIC